MKSNTKTNNTINTNKEDVKMKGNKRVEVLKGIMTASLITLAIFSCATYERSYTRTNCKIVQVNDGFATVLDEQNNAWDIQAIRLEDGSEVDGTIEQVNDGFATVVDKRGNVKDIRIIKLMVGDTVSLTMDDNGTPNNTTDDVVRKVIK